MFRKFKNILSKAGSFYSHSCHLQEQLNNNNKGSRTWYTLCRCKCTSYIYVNALVLFLTSFTWHIKALHIVIPRVSAWVCTWALRIVVLKVQSFLSLSLTCSLDICIWSSRGEWSLSPLGDSLLFRSKLVPIHEWQV